MLARQQIDFLWRQTGVLRDEIRRSAFRSDGAHAEDPTLAWDRRLVPTDTGPEEFAVLHEGVHWVAQAIIEGAVVGIESRNWALETTGLRAEADLEPYARGHECCGAAGCSSDPACGLILAQRPLTCRCNLAPDARLGCHSVAPIVRCE